MAGRTADALVHMNRVIEIRKVRKVVDANPFQRLARLETCAHGFKIRTVGPDLFMAIHAHRGRRHARGGRSLDRRVAIAAINTVVANVMLMTELDRLLAFDPLARIPSRASNLCRDPKGREQNKDRAINRGPRQVVRAMTENLWHRRKRLADGLVRSLLPADGTGPASPRYFLETVVSYYSGAITLTR